MYAIIFSKTDEASMNIYKHAQSLRSISHVFEESMLDMNELGEKIDADVFIFASKHWSNSGKPALTVHAPGNWGIADMGGDPEKLNLCPASLIKKTLQKLEEKASDSKYDIIQEATHHGPTISKPCIFLEIGSREPEWNDPWAAKIIVEVLEEITKEEPKEYPSVVGIGGLHHCPNFKTIQLESEYAVGHVCPKYNLESLTREMLLQAMEKSVPKAELVLVDWKGLGEHKDKVRTILEGIEWKKTKDLK